jgi:replication factor C small subunit
MATILVTESVEFDLDTLDSYVKATYPDLRKCINLCQMNTVEGKLSAPHGDEGGATSDYLLAVVDLLKRGRTREARTLLCQNVRSEDMEGLFRWMYDNLDLWGTTPERQDQAIVIIRNGAANNSLVADHEINLSATIVELVGIN